MHRQRVAPQPGVARGGHFDRRYRFIPFAEPTGSAPRAIDRIARRRSASASVTVEPMNRASYNKIAAQWDGARTSFHGAERRFLQALLAGLDAPARVLDLGCGSGRPMAEYVLARGHELTGVDQAEQMLALARERYPSAIWIHAAIEDVPLDTSYHAVILWDCLFHLPRALHRSILRRIHDALVPGGRLMLTVGGSAHPPFTDTMFGERFFYDSHPPDRVETVLEEIGFEVTLAEFLNVPTDGRDKGRYAIVAQRPLST